MHDVAYTHGLVRLQRDGHDLLLHLAGKDARGERVALAANEQVGEGAAVRICDVAAVRQGCEGFLGEVKRVRRALLKRGTRVLHEVGKLERGLAR